MAQIVKLRRSSVSGQKPTNSNLQLGELALNTTDGKVFMAVSGSGGPSVEELISTNTVNTGSIYLTDNVTASFFTGSFIGDGSQIYNIPSSGVTGLELNKIISGSVSASISPDRGLEINTDVTISGSFPPGSPSASLKVYGNTEIDGYAKFLPVTTTLNTSITGSYIFVSGSTDDLYFSQNGNGYSNITRLRWLEGNLYSGLLHGGKITAVTGSTTFSIDAGSGIIVDLNASLLDDPYPTITFVEWDTFTGQTLTYRTTHIQTYLAIDDTGNIVQSTSPFIATQYNSLITLGTVIHQNLSTVNASITYPNVAYGYKQRTYDFVKAFGPLKLSGLNLITTGSLGLNVGSGTAFADGRNYQTDPNNPSYITDSGTAVSKIFRYYQVSGTTFVQDTNNGAGYSGIDPTKYVLNGVLTNVSGDYSIQRVFWYPNSATKGIVVYYGNATYGTIREAIDNLNIEPFNETENTKQNAVLLGTIIIAGNGDFTQSNKFSIVPGGLFRSIGGSSGGGNIPTSRLFDLSDVDVVYQQDNDLLVYNVDTLKWESKKSLEGNYTITGSLNVTGGLTGSIDYSNVTNKPTLVSGSSQIEITGTTGYSTFSSSISNSISSSIDIISSSIATTTNLLDGRIDSLETESGSIRSDFNSFTSSYTTGAFTGSFIGDGIGLYNIPASGVTGLQLDKIVSGNASASIDDTGLRVNRDVYIDGTLTAKELHIDYVTSSILYQSGSTKFGDTTDDTHQFTGSVYIDGNLNVDSITGSIDFSNITNKPTLVSGSSQISYTGIADVPNGIVSSSSQISYTGITDVPNGIVSGSSQISYTGITNVPNGIISGSLQIVDLGFTTTSSFESFTSSYNTDSQSFDSRINTFTASINSLNSFSSSVVLTSQTSSMTVLSASYAVTAAFALNAGAGGGGVATIGSYASLEQTTGATTWSFVHNIGQRYPIFQVFNGSGDVIIPTQIRTIDENIAEIIFGSDQTGTAIASLGGGNGTTQEFNSSALWTVDHNLNTDYPDVTIWDSNRNIIFPNRIESVNSNQIKVYFSVPVSGHVSVSRGGHIISGSGGVSSWNDLEDIPSGLVSSSSQISYTGISNIPSGIVSGSSQLTGSYDTRYVLSGSITQTTWDNIANKPVGIVSGSVQVELTGTTGYSTFSSSINTSISGSVSNLSSSIASTDSTQNGRLNSLETTSASLLLLSSSIDNAFEFTGSNVTIKGDFLIKGTTTIVESTTLNIGDNIVSLNGTGATNAGLVVRDATSPNTVSGSLLWDSTNDYWIAGDLGNEERIILEGDFNSFTSSYNTGSFTGSFTGNGSGLTNLSNITGSVGQVAILSSDKTVSGSQFTYVTNQTFGLGTNAVNNESPERLMVDNFNSYNIATFQTSQQETYAEVNIKNFGSGSSSSSDLVLWNNVTTPSSSFLNLGINSSNYNAGYVGYGGDGYLFNHSNDLYLGSMNSIESGHGHVHIFGGGMWDSSSISIYSDGTIGINTDKEDTTASTIPSSVDGYAVEISGSVYFRNNVSVSGFANVTGSLNVTGGITGSIDYSNITNKPTLVSGSSQIVGLGFLETSSFNSYTSSNDGRVSSLESKTGSYSTTGSNSFIGNENINGNLSVTGSVVISGSLDISNANVGSSRYLHTQTSTSATWSISHNLGYDYPNVTVYDGVTNKIMLPSDVTSINGNTTEVTFATPEYGYALVSVGGITTATADRFLFTATSATGSWVIDHNLGYKYPNIDVYDEDDEQLIPQVVKAVSVNRIQIDFATPTSGNAIITLGGPRSTSIFNQTGSFYTTQYDIGITGSLVVTGDVDASSFNTTSDKLLKTNLERIEGALDKIEQLNGYTFDWIDDYSYDKTRQIGMIANEVHAVQPELTSNRTIMLNDKQEEILLLDYSKLTVLLIEAVKELSDKVKKLEDKLNKK